MNGRTLFHYINIFSPEDNKKLYIYKTILFELIKLPIDLNKKDIFKRNGLFYLFIDFNEKIRKQDPYLKLELCLKNCGVSDINDVDIYGNSLIFYAVQIKAYKSIKILIEHKASLNIKNKEGNTIYSIASILGDYDLFILLYNANKDNSIFLQKVYSSQQFESNKIKEKNSIESLMDLHKSMRVSIPDKIIFKEQLVKINEKYCLNNKQYSDIKIFSSNFKSNYIDLLNDELKKLLYEFNKEIMIEKDDENIDFFIEKKYLMEIKENFMKDSNQFLEQISKGKSVLLGDNLFQYCKLKEYENICGFILNNNYHLISVCKDLLSLKKENEFNYYIHLILYEKDLLNYKNEENISIFHILSKIKNNLSFYKENNLDKYNISNLYDDLGNTPIYYACHKLNISFIEIFSNYSFSSINNDSKNIKYSLFIETKNKTCPLKSLYLQLDKKEIKILKLIIDISINIKKVYILHILLFLIKNYKSFHKKYFNLPYKDNINNNDYIIKIIGLYLFYKEELKGNFSNEELQGINPIFLCFNNKNFDFLFDILMKQKNIEINNRNKDGKSLIHLIVEMKEDKKKYNFNKKDILIKALDYGLDFKIKDNNGKEPIYYAILNKDNDILDILK